MRAGLFLAYWPWFSPEEPVELAVLADELGLDSVWISEAWGQEEWTLPHPGGMGLGKPLKLLGRPVHERIPVYLGAIGPKAIEQTSEIADRWLPFMLDPTRPEVLLDALDRGLEKAGRTRADMDIAATVPVSIDDDLAAARDAVRPWIAWYLGAMGAPEKNFYVGDRPAVVRQLAAAVGAHV